MMVNLEALAHFSHLAAMFPWLRAVHSHKHVAQVGAGFYLQTGAWNHTAQEGGEFPVLLLFWEPPMKRFWPVPLVYPLGSETLPVGNVHIAFVLQVES